MDCIGERILNAFCGAVAVYDEECKTFCFQYCPEKVVQLLEGMILIKKILTIDISYESLVKIFF